ncbi:Permease of the drug/metabolite transporter (DMT) superfamily [Saccharopolyspora kobensis]|uniref:Permease of the drug/metabolite transporter (DMT) superfamily n=1 Tax=Saccharopolyspora kobensis TaxID=146035 RepID=A0A1H5ZY76_9PSEU|nr:DMT family transporter [Saccharopolyspora kobensis]SEG41463.1 Permease of the drug/metabolite transporter (DMT) superfamily [Saccharopolyspora kobensis]SFE16388.1 Permease of the drug/metabolite transporter (DMT) superfamily [Saccharopolyspora kobensis]
MFRAPGVAKAGIAVQFALLAVAWGSSFLLIKIGLDELSPAQVVLARMLFGALALGALVAITRRPVPRDPRAWGHLAVVAILLCVVPFALFAWAEQRISSGLASILNATTPLITMLFATAMVAGERMNRNRTSGLVLGFAGVVVIIGPWRGLGEHDDLLPQLACLGATACYGLAFAYLRRFVSGRGHSAPALAFVQVLIGAVIMVVAAPWAASEPVDRLSGAVVVSMVVLGAFGTGMAYVWNNNIVAAWGAANAAAVTYLSPVVGVLLGVVLMGEPLTWNQPVGAALVLLGIMAAHGRLGGIGRRGTPATSGGSRAAPAHHR